jgi:hypothetical protein
MGNVPKSAQSRAGQTGRTKSTKVAAKAKPKAKKAATAKPKAASKPRAARKIAAPEVPQSVAAALLADAGPRGAEPSAPLDKRAVEAVCQKVLSEVPQASRAAPLGAPEIERIADQYFRQHLPAAAQPPSGTRRSIVQHLIHYGNEYRFEIKVLTKILEILTEVLAKRSVPSP